MALISNARGRGENETPSGYERLFGNRQLGMLMSKVQSAVISTGNELEGMLANEIKDTKGISIQKINKENRVFKGIKDGHDIIIDCVVEKNGKFMLIEIKDGRKMFTIIENWRENGNSFARNLFTFSKYKICFGLYEKR